ncbi:hypothetical protein VKT23_009806 [Stygiomarasmius scandens]|uniref:Enoyl reductase (ER) domain-containing protein n=1 Tax=Marasmiellus scandens TaxID=2682957 RepID=A0ABR1JDF2_9AGAR
MAPIRNTKLIFNAPVSGLPEPGKSALYDTTNTIDPEAVPLNGSVLIKLLYISIDPLMRGQMRDSSLPSSFPFPAYSIGQPTYGYGVGKIIRSEKDGLENGDYVVSQTMEHAEYSIPTNPELLEKITPEPGLPPSVYVGIAGMPGRTAYFAWREFSKAKKGETAFVSTAAGPVGSLVLQLAKLEGLKVIASVGSDEKVEVVKSLGADVAFNYKTADMQDILAKEGPIDIYWDNVSGSTLDAALANAALHARFICCGMLSVLGTKMGEGIPMKNLMNIVVRRVTMNGFIMTDLTEKWEKEFNEVIPKKLASGEIKYIEDKTRGLENVVEGLVELMSGKNVGKKIVVVSDD